MAKKISRNEIAESNIFGDIKSSAEETIGVIDKLSQALNETAEAVKKSVGGAKFDSSKAVDNFVKGTEKANKLQKQAIELDTTRAKAVLARKKAMEGQQRVLQQQEKTVQQRIKTEETMARQKARLNKEGERAARVAKAENSEYTKLVKKTRDLKNASKELAASMIKLESSGKKNTTAYREMARQYKSVTNEAKAGDKTLKKIDSTVGDNFRNVGNYTGALKGLGKGLLQLGGGLSAIQLLKGAGGIVVDFDQAVADLGAISGKSAEEMAGLTEQAKDLGATTQFSATQITEMQIELAKLGFTNEQISQSTEAISNFAAATGADIPQAAQLAGSAMRGFGMDASEMDRVVSVLGVATTKSALSFDSLNSGLANVAPVANAFGFSIEDTTALLGQLANAGFDASTASTATKNILLNLADSSGDLAVQLGRPITSADDLAEGLKELKDKGIDLGEALDLTDKRSVAAFNTFLEGSDDLVELRDSITDVNDELEAMAAKKLNTIGGQFTLLTSAWEGFILSVNEGTGAGAGIKQFIGFMAANLSRIMSVLGSLIIAWGTYKTALLSVRAINFLMTGGLKDMVGTLKTSIRNVGKMGTSVDSAGKKVKGFGASMKTIPFILIITALIEMAKAFYDIASGAKEAAEASAEVERIEELGVKKSTKRSSDRAKALANELTANEQLFRKKEKTEAQIRVLNEDAIKSTRERAKEDRKAVGERSAQLQNDLDELKGYTKQWNGFTKRAGGKSGAELAKIAKRLGMDSLAKGFKEGMVETSKFNKAVTITKGKIQAGWAKWKVYNEEVKEYGFQMNEAQTQTFETNDNLSKIDANINNVTSGTKKLNTEFSRKIDLLSEQNKLMKEQRELEEDISQIENKRDIDNLEDQIDAEIDVQRRKAETTGEIDVDVAEKFIFEKQKLKEDAINQEANFEIKELKKKFAEEKKLRRDELQSEYFDLIAGANGNAEALEKIEANHKFEIDKLKKVEEIELKNAGLKETEILEETKNEIKDIHRESIAEIKSMNDELIDEQLAYAAKQGKISIETTEKTAKKTIEKEQDMWQDRMDIAQVATDFLTQMSDKRMKKIDDEISKAETQADFLRTLAANGNIDAKDSLAEQQQIIDEANRKKIQEEKLKAKIEFANTVFQTYGAKVQAGSASPLADTIKDVSLLQQFVAQFTPTFKDGTEDTGSHGQGIDGQGGFHAILHPNERVLTKEQNKAVGGLSNDSLAKVAQDYQNGKIMQEGASQIGQGWDTSIVVKRLESLEQTIKDKPEHSLRVEDVVTGALTIVRETKEGNTLNYNRYRIRK